MNFVELVTHELVDYLQEHNVFINNCRNGEHNQMIALQQRWSSITVWLNRIGISVMSLTGVVEHYSFDYSDPKLFEQIKDVFLKSIKYERSMADFYGGMQACGNNLEIYLNQCQ